MGGGSDDLGAEDAAAADLEAGWGSSSGFPFFAVDLVVILKALGD